MFLHFCYKYSLQVSIDRLRPSSRHASSQKPVPDKRSSETACALDKATRHEAAEVLRTNKVDAQMYEKRGPKKLILSNEKNHLIRLVESSIEIANKNPEGPIGNIRFWDPKLAIDPGTAGILPPFKQFSSAWIRLVMGSRTKEGQHARAALLECYKGDCFFPELSGRHHLAQLKVNASKKPVLQALGGKVSDLQIMSFMFGWEVLKQEALSSKSTKITTLRNVTDFDRYKVLQNNTPISLAEDDDGSEADLDQVEKRSNIDNQEQEHFSSQDLVGIGIQYLKKVCDIKGSIPPTFVARNGDCLWASLELSTNPEFSDGDELLQRARVLRESSISQGIKWVETMPFDDIKLWYTEDKSRDELIEEMAKYKISTKYAGDIGDFLPIIGAAFLKRPILVLSVTKVTDVSRERSTKVNVNGHIWPPDALFPSTEEDKNNICVIVHDPRGVHYEPVSVPEESAQKLKLLYQDMKKRENVTLGPMETDWPIQAVHNAEGEADTDVDADAHSMKQVALFSTSPKETSAHSTDLLEVSDKGENKAEAVNGASVPSSSQDKTPCSKEVQSVQVVTEYVEKGLMGVSDSSNDKDEDPFSSPKFSDEETEEASARETRSVVGAIAASLINDLPTDVLDRIDVKRSEEEPEGYHGSDDSFAEDNYEPSADCSSSSDDDGVFYSSAPPAKKRKADVDDV